MPFCILVFDEPERPRTTAGGHPHARIVFLAQDRRGYGNLCEAITLARRRTGKGQYLAEVADYEGKTAKAPHLAGLPGCIALLLPEPNETVEALFAKAMWLRTRFDGRAWLLEPRPMLMDDELQCWVIEQVADLTGLGAVATASPVMHTPCASRCRTSSRPCAWDGPSASAGST